MDPRNDSADEQATRWDEPTIIHHEQPAEQFAAGSVIGDKYRCERPLGTGGMATVFLATNLAIGRRVAVKVLNNGLVGRADLARRLELEARAPALIGHPGIVDVLDLGVTSRGSPFIVMEHLEGGTLAELRERVGGFTPRQVAGVMGPVLDALASAHAANIVHRDVKPSNIFVCTKLAQGVKLLDFGVSRFGDHSEGLTEAGTTIGTPLYMAPEQVLGADVTPAVDLYAVGAVMYSLLTGKAPHEGGSDLKTMQRILTQDHQPLAELRPDAPPALCALIDELLARDAASRPADASVARARLEAAVPQGGDLSSLTAALVRPASTAAEVLVTVSASSPTTLRRRKPARAGADSQGPKPLTAGEPRRPRASQVGTRSLPVPVRRPRWSPVTVLALLFVLGMPLGASLACLSAKALAAHSASGR